MEDIGEEDQPPDYKEEDCGMRVIKRNSNFEGSIVGYCWGRIE